MQKKLENKHLKKAAVEQVFVWIVLFTLFVSILFFIINYTLIVRTIDTVDSLADFGANYVGRNGIGDDLSNTMNNIATKNINNISAETSTLCTTAADGLYEVIFTVTSTNTSFYFYDKPISSRRVVFNQDGTGNSITCNLSITIQE